MRTLVNVLRGSYHPVGSIGLPQDRTDNDKTTLISCQVFCWNRRKPCKQEGLHHHNKHTTSTFVLTKKSRLQAIGKPFAILQKQRSKGYTQITSPSKAFLKKTKKSQKQRSNGYKQITSPSKAILLKRRSRGCKTNEATFALSWLWTHCFRTNEEKFQIKKNSCERVPETLRRSEDVRKKYFSDWQSVISREWAWTEVSVKIFLVKMFLGQNKILIWRQQQNQSN